MTDRNLSLDAARIVSTYIAADGQVSSGRGLATLELFALREELREIVKDSLWPGSLNVVLKRPLRLRENVGFRFGAGRLMVWPASLNGLDVWLYRWPEAPLHIVEVLSSKNLRERLALRDGDNVTLQLRDDQIGPIDSFGRFVWAALWVGRRSWFYKRDEYYHNTPSSWKMNVFTGLGAAQKQPVGPVRMSFWVSKKIVKRLPVVGTFLRKSKSLSE